MLGTGALDTTSTGVCLNITDNSPSFYFSLSHTHTLGPKATGNGHSGPGIISGFSHFHPTACVLVCVCLCLSISNEIETGHQANHSVGGENLEPIR